MIGPFLIILTILMILIMSVAAVLAVIFAARKPEPLNKSLRTLSILLLVYLLCAFLQYYFQQNQLSLAYIKTAGCLADICYFMFIVSWLHIILEFSQVKGKIGIRIICAVTAVYGIAAECIVVFAGRDYSLDRGLVIDSSILRGLLLSLNAMYAAAVLFLSAYYFITALKSKKTGTLFFSGMLILYMLWISILDYDMVYQAGKRFTENILVDPLLIVYCILDLAVIFFFFRKDPLELLAGQNEIMPQQQLEAFAAEKILTKREFEVLALVCQGKTNPDIAAELCISEYTVKRHLNHIFQKADVKNRYELISNVMHRHE